MRTVFSNSKVPHIWASQRQPTARNSSSSMSFEGTSFFSYRTCVARILPDNSVVLAKYGYSSSTSRHIREVRAAVSDRVVWQIQRVEECTPEQVLAHGNEELTERLEKASRARTRADMYLLEASNIVNNYNGYLDAIQYAGPRLVLDPSINLLEIEARIVAQREEHKQQEALAELELKSAELARLPAWLAGGPLTHRFYRVGCHLRVKGENVETSEGASITVETAKGLWKFLESCKTDTQRRRIHGTALEGYKVTSCTAETLVVGCHNIPMLEISKIAEVLGLSPLKSETL